MNDIYGIGGGEMWGGVPVRYNVQCNSGFIIKMFGGYIV